MKNSLLFFLCIPFLGFPQSPSKKIKVLFLGNSYTYVNNLPNLVYNVALANGDTLVYDANTIGGYTLKNHFDDAQSISKINSTAWKFVVLQAQSQEPSFSPAQVNAQTLPYAIKLDSVIKQNACRNTVFYETWGRKNGDAQNCSAYPPVCSYIGMQDRLKQSYKKFADTTMALMAPVGEAFRRSIALNPMLELYDADESHPSLAGTYLAAAVFYEVLFQKSVAGNTYNPGIPATVAVFLKDVAHSVVKDSLAAWNLGVNFPWAAFTHSPSGTGLQFTPASPAGNFAIKWYFGDGSTSSIPSPAHTYANQGNYSVSHVVSDGCNKDSVSATVTFVTGLRKNYRGDAPVFLFPNPVENTLYIGGIDGLPNDNVYFEIRSALGEVVASGGYHSSVDVSQLNSGVYFLKISDGEFEVKLRFVKVD